MHPCKVEWFPLRRFRTLSLRIRYWVTVSTVIPADGRIYAPADGEVAMVFDTLHAVTLTKHSGRGNTDTYRTGYSHT